jgi:hypothetical protein
VTLQLPWPKLAALAMAFARASDGSGHRASRTVPWWEFLQVDTTDILFVCGGAFGGPGVRRCLVHPFS